MAWRTVKLGDICTITKGQTGITKAVPGEYPLVALSEERRSHNEYQFDAEAVIIPLVSSTGHGHASLKRIHFQSGKFALGTILCALIPKHMSEVRAEYLYHYLDMMKEILFVPLMKGMANVSLPMKRIAGVEIPLPEPNEQESTVGMLQKHKAIHERLNAESHKQRTLLSKYRQSILQEAIEGTLTADWREKHPDIEPACELLKRIATEKTELVKQKKIRKKKAIPEIDQDEIPFEIPDSWQWCRLGDACFVFQYGTSSKSKKHGKVPVLRMGNIQSGLIDWDSLVYTDNAEEIEKFNLVAGDLLFNRTNSRELVGKTGLYQGERQSIYAGYLVRFHMAGDIIPEYANVVMNSDLHAEWCQKVKSDAIGQSNINATKLSLFYFPLPPLEEQQELVRQVESKFLLCDTLEAEISASAHSADTLSAAILQELFGQNGGGN